ncbi:MAG TPA: hypothetical protein VMY16_08805 [Ilumatobacteraceae bacterium]|nr:hypothetical protein [Ilumatobacteraceae bacterium]
MGVQGDRKPDAPIGEELIAESGHTDAELQTRVDNDRAISLYRSAGWQLTDRLIHNAHHGIEYDEHVLVKHLDDRVDVQSSSSPASDPSARQSSSTLMNATEPAP